MGRGLFLLVLSWWVVASPSVVAQSEGEQPFTPGNLLNPLPDVLSEGTLQPKARLWLSDRDGNQILVPEETAEDYFSSRGGVSGGGIGLSPVALERVEVEADARGEAAHVTGRFSLVLSQDFATTVNLGFGEVQVNHTTFSGDTTQNRLLTVRDDPGWRWIVQGDPKLTQTATLTGVSRIVSELERRSLKISLPTAPCTLHIQLPSNADDLRVRNEDVLQRKDSTEGVVEVEVTCRGGEFTLSWRDRAELPQLAAVIASSETRFEVLDPTQPWLARTTLKLRWHGRDAPSQVRIELPPGGQWGPLPNSDPERYMILGQDEAWLEPPAVGVTAVGNPTELLAQDVHGDALASPAAMPLMLVNFDVSRNESLENIELEWEWVPTLQQAESAATEIKIQTPVLHGVDQHTGLVDCIVTSAYAVVFKEGTGTQLVYQAPLMDTFGRHQLQFRFDRQPFDLKVNFRREQSLPTIRPTYLVHVDRHKLTLTMWFDCSFDTNQPQMELGLMLDEWVIQENTARMVSDPNNLFSSEGDVLRVMQQVDRNYVVRSTGGQTNNYGGVRHVDQTWRVVAERAWTPEDHELYFQVPQIIRGRVDGDPEIDHGSGAVLVTSDSNVLLSWQETAGTGLQPDSFSTEYERFVPPSAMRKPLVYRFQSSETTPRWAGRSELLPRQVTVGQDVELEVGMSQIAINQDFELQVANEALNELRFAVRLDAAESQPPQVLINGQLVSVKPLAQIEQHELNALLKPAAVRLPPATPDMESSNPSPSIPNAIWQTYQIDRPEILGATHVAIQSSVNWKASEIGRPADDGRPLTDDRTSRGEQVSSEVAQTSVDVPLAQLLLPDGVRRARQAWTLTADPRIEALAEAAKSPNSEALLGGQRSGTLDGVQTDIQLELRPRRLLGIAPVRIEMSWLQSFVSDQKRRERFVARVSSSSDELQLKLPPAANIREESVKISVNGFSQAQAYSYDRRSDIVTIPLSGGHGTSHVVEVSYFLPDSLSWISVLSVSPPEILGAEQDEQFYWQLLTPSVQHLGWSPRKLTAEWTWQWSGLCWKRASQLNQRQLEELLGARSQEPPPASANSYVMSGRGTIRATDAWVLSRFILWFPVGSLAIAISFTALNYSVVRKPSVVFALASALAAMATVWPDLAVLAAQTSLLSLGLVVLVWVCQAAVDSRVRRRSVFSTRPSTYIERSDQYSIARGGRATPAVAATASHGSSAGTSGG